MDNRNLESSIKLLDDAYKNVKMGNFAIDTIVSKIENKDLVKLLQKQNSFYFEKSTTLEHMAEQLSHQVKDINAMLKASSFFSINVKTMVDKSTSHIAEMLIEGTTMGITTLIKEIKDNPAAQSELIEVSSDIVAHQEKFVEELKDFL